MSAAKMHQFALVSLFALPLAAFADDNPFGYHKEPLIVGRWDINVHGADGDYPSWLEVTKSGYGTLVGSFVGQFGSARPISNVVNHDGQITFTIPPQYEHRTNDMTFTARLDRDILRGETTDENGRRITFEARRAPPSPAPRTQAGQNLSHFSMAKISQAGTREIPNQRMVGSSRMATSPTPAPVMT